MNTINEGLARVINRIAIDKKLRARIIANPKIILKQFGIELPINTEIEVKIPSADSSYFIIPANMDETISVEQLAFISAGKFQSVSTMTTTTSFSSLSTASSDIFCFSSASSLINNRVNWHGASCALIRGDIMPNNLSKITMMGDVLTKISAKVNSSAALRQKFMDNPRDIMVSLGFTPPKHIEFKGFMNSAEYIYFVIPNLAQDGEINNQESSNIIAAAVIQTASSAGTISSAASFSSQLSTFSSASSVFTSSTAGSVRRNISAKTSIINLLPSHHGSIGE